MKNALTEAGIYAVEQFSTGNRYGYIIDFALPSQKLIIECDGEKYHAPGNRKDKIRDIYFGKRGWRIIRLRGKEIDNNISGCIEKILAAVRSGKVQLISVSSGEIELGMVSFGKVWILRNYRIKMWRGRV